MKTLMDLSMRRDIAIYSGKVCWCTRTMQVLTSKQHFPRWTRVSGTFGHVVTSLLTNYLGIYAFVISTDFEAYAFLAAAHPCGRLSWPSLFLSLAQTKLSDTVYLGQPQHDNVHDTSHPPGLLPRWAAHAGLTSPSRYALYTDASVTSLKFHRCQHIHTWQSQLLRAIRCSCLLPK